MADKNKNKNDKRAEATENVESVDVQAEEAQESFNAEKVDFDALDEKGKKEAFDKVKMQNAMLISLVQEFNKEVEELNAKANGKVSDDSYKRLAADFENYKRRNASSVSAAYGDGKFEVLKAFLDVTDNFDRAIATIKDEASLNGVKMISKQFNEILTKFNVKEIEALGKPFDPNLHHAVMQGEAEKPELVDTVMEVFQKGYEVDGKVLRYCFVKVAK